MGRFLAGFLVASLLWGGALLVWWRGWLSPGEELAVADRPDAAPDATVASGEAGRRPGRRRRPSSARGRAGRPDREAESGDDLGEGGPRLVDLGEAGGDARLSSAQLDAGFDPAMARVRRCVLLAPEDAAVRGRVVFGMRIRPSGEVTAVHLTGPSSLTTGEAGGCMRAAARGLRFPAFDGPEMVVRYPVTFE